MDVNIKVEVPALEKLIDYAASGIGAVAGTMMATWIERQKGKAKRIKAEADADSLRLIADAQADARRSLVTQDEVRRGILEIGPDGIAQRVEFQEKKRQANIASVVQDAAAELGETEVPDHAPDPDWTARFFDCVQDVSSADMRKIWAKILSGEVKGPGQTSLRTLDILKNMTAKDAHMFRETCDFIIDTAEDNFIFFPNEYHRDHPVLSLGRVIHLQDFGLLHIVSSLQNTIKFSHKDNDGHFLIYKNKILRILAKEGQKEVSIPVLAVPKSGRELYQVVRGQYRKDYMQSLSRFLDKNNCELSQADVVRNPDGSITYSGSFTIIESEPK